MILDYFLLFLLFSPPIFYDRYLLFYTTPTSNPSTHLRVWEGILSKAIIKNKFPKVQYVVISYTYLTNIKIYDILYISQVQKYLCTDANSDPFLKGIKKGVDISLFLCYNI